MVARGKRAGAEFKYDVCLSFAGEDRSYVRAVARHLQSWGVRVFFDEYEEAELWGKDLYAHLHDLYQNAARYCVMFISTCYAKKMWPSHERASAQARAIREHREYVLPARFDDSTIPGLPATTGYVDLSRTPPNKLAELVVTKLGKGSRSHYLPPNPDRLYKLIGVRSKRSQDHIGGVARHLFEVFLRMSEEERNLVFLTFNHGCPGDLPTNIHIDLDLLRRYSKLTPLRIVRLLGGLRSLGFYCRLRDNREKPDEHLGISHLLELEWHDMRVEIEDDTNYTAVLNDLLKAATEGFCETCAARALKRLDFSQLSTATHTQEKHKRRRVGAAKRKEKRDAQKHMT